MTSLSMWDCHNNAGQVRGPTTAAVVTFSRFHGGHFILLLGCWDSWWGIRYLDYLARSWGLCPVSLATAQTWAHQTHYSSGLVHSDIPGHVVVLSVCNSACCNQTDSPASWACVPCDATAAADSTSFLPADCPILAAPSHWGISPCSTSLPTPVPTLSLSKGLEHKQPRAKGALFASAFSDHYKSTAESFLAIDPPPQAGAWLKMASTGMCCMARDALVRYRHCVLPLSGVGQLPHRDP